MRGCVGVVALDEDFNVSVLGAKGVDVIDQPIRNPTHGLASSASMSKDVRTMWRAVVVYFVDPLEQVTRLTAEYPAHGLQGAEANSPGTTVLQHGHVCRREPDTLGELPHTQLALGQFDVDPHHDGHQITASMSARSVVACRSSARITTISSPSTAPATNINSSAAGSPGSSQLTAK